jgi:hypothetical protein
MIQMLSLRKNLRKKKRMKTLKNTNLNFKPRFTLTQSFYFEEPMLI